MKKSSSLLLIFSVVCFPLFAANPARTGDFQFIQNEGQWQEQISYMADVYGGDLYLEKNCFTWSFSNMSELTAYKHHGNLEDLDNFMIKKHAFKTHFINARADVQLSGEERFSNYYNYFLGNDQATWKGGVPAFGAVRYTGLYDGIDMLVYSREGSMKYDLLISPNTSPEQIKFGYEGLKDIRIVDGNLELITSINTIVEFEPVAWQVIDGKNIPVTCAFVLTGNEISFSFPDGYDPDHPLIIDPATLIFASYSGATSDNWGYSATYDDAGNLYGAGIAFADGYPVTLGAFQEDYSPSVGAYIADVTISKFTSDGISLIYSTYLGGSSEDLPYSLIVDSDTNLVVYGSTGSSNFPTTTDGFDKTFNGGSDVTVDIVLRFADGSDAFVSKFNYDGTELIGSTYLGGSENDALNEGATAFNYGDHARGEVMVDALDNVYIASCTRSSNLPTTPGAFQDDYSGGQDGFIAKFNNDLSDLEWCSYIGGDGDDGSFSIKKMNGAKFLICGGTESTDFPTTAGALHEDYLGGRTDGFAMIIDDDATEIIYATYVGTDDYEIAYLSEIDDFNSVYLTGQTTGDFPVVGDVYENPGSTQFVIKLDSTLSTIEFSTVFGSGSSEVNISPTAFLVDNCQHIYVAGWGGAVNAFFNTETGTTDDMPITGDAFQSSTDGSDFYLIVLDNNAASLIYATYFGGAGSDEHVDGGTSRFDKNGFVYEAVCAGCGGSDDFPTTEGVVSNTNNSPNCNLGVFKFQFTIPPTTAAMEADPLTGCSPLTVDFTNHSINSDGVFWEFGTGATSTENDPTYTYEDPGVYKVSMVATVPEICGINDTAELSIEVYGYPEADFMSAPHPGSVFAATNFTDMSTDAVSWFWEFGDGNTSTEQNPTHFYASTGLFEICLTVENSYGCESKTCDTITILEKSILDVPNAFSPNGDGINDEFFPVNYGLDNFEFKIYNRWGELIFLSNDPTKGWNGVYNGVEQELAVYIYIISGNGVDGIPYYRQGNFTLVR